MTRPEAAEHGPRQTACIRRSRRLLCGSLLLAMTVVTGCMSLPTERRASLVPTQHQLRVGPYQIATNELLSSDAPAVAQLLALEDEVSRTLQVSFDPASDPIEVYILDNREAFNHFLTYYYADLPPRRAFFFAQGTRRVVYTYQGKRLEEDLRHEATHALLHTAAEGLPLWLDEGLAEYFEQPDAPGGITPEHLTRLRDDFSKGWRPDLGRLEVLTDVRQMSPRDYREAWAWTHFLLDGPYARRQILIDYLGEMQRGRAPSKLSPLLADTPHLDRALASHLDGIRETVVASRNARPTTIRLQDAAPPGHDAFQDLVAGERTVLFPKTRRLASQAFGWLLRPLSRP